MNSLVSIIVACYNQASYLTEAIESVLSQSYNNWECIIVNDGSTDDSEQVALKLMQKDVRIQYYKIENSGVSFVRNFGIEKSKGNYILPLDADDKIHPYYLKKAIEILENTDAKLVYCEVVFFDAKTGRFNLPNYSLAELAKMNMIVCTAFFSKQDFLNAGGYNLNMRLGWEDWDLWISMLKNGGSVYKIGEELFYYRIKEGSRTANLEGGRKQKMSMQLYLNHPDFFDKFYNEPIEFFDKYRRLKKYCNELEESKNLYKGIITLKLNSYKQLVKKIMTKRRK